MILKVLWPIFLILFFVIIHPDVKKIFYENISEFIYVFILSFIVSFLATPIMSRIAKELKIVDEPNSRKIHSSAMPLLGGVAIWAGVILAVLWNYELSLGVRRIFLAATMLLVIGILDDIMDVSAKLRLFVQILASSFIIYSGIRLSFLPAGLWGDIGEIVITVIWLIGITNAFNFFDGMDGLAAGLAFISSITFFIISLDTNEPALSFISLAIAGSSLGFLYFNFHPASIFMGDGGSNFLGFLLAALAVYGTWSNQDPIVSFCIPLMVLSPLIFDMIYITVARVYRGDVTNIKEWIEYTGLDHFHHRVKSIGLSDTSTVLFLYLITALVCIGAILVKELTLIYAIFVIIQAVLIYSVVVILMLLSKGAVEDKDYILEKIRELKERVYTQDKLRTGEPKKELETETINIARELLDDIRRGSL
ncbi:MAG: MraY family glycosyltransferase [Candidatus Hydrogenedentota bacterium]